MPINEQLADENWRRFTYMRDRGHNEFLQKANRCDNFFVGNQWHQEDLLALTDSGRPALTINKIIATVGTILGEQIYNRTEVLFRPSNGAPAEVAEALSKVWMQISQNNQLPWLRSDVFADGIIRSRGFYDVRMDYSDNAQGEVRIAPINSKNVLIDPDAEEYDPDKWNDVICTRWMTTNDIAVLYNESDAKYLVDRAGYTRYGNDSIDRTRDSFASMMGHNQPSLSPYALQDMSNARNVRVIDRQYRKLDKMKHFVDIETGDMRPIPEGWDRDKIALVIEKTGGRVAVTKKLVKRIRWMVTADTLVLHDDWSPYKHFTVVPYFPHFRYGQTVGIVENLLGPQEILNKVSSQELHIVNTTANSGYMVEEDSLVNMTVQELEANGAKTGVVIEYKKGAQPPAKIQPNQPPSGLDRISMKAEEHIKTISNVSDSMTGFDRSDVAAKAIAYKQQRGSVNLSKVLDNLERSDYILARNVLDLVQEFYTDERIINITHDDFTKEPEQIVVNTPDPVTGAITNDLTIGEYDIVITSSPYRASLEDSQFEQAKALREIGIPIPDDVLIENSRLLRRADIVKRMQSQATSPEAQQQAELQLRNQQAEVMVKEANAQKTATTAELNRVRAMKELQQSENPQAEQSVELQKMQLEHELKLKQLEEEMALAKYKIDQEIELKRYEMEQELRIKAQAAEAEAQARRVEALRNPTPNPQGENDDGY